MKRTVKLLWSLLFATFLLACGGSDNSGPHTTPPPPSGAAQFAYVSNSDSSSITAYQINSGTGAISLVAGSPFGGVDLPTGLAMAPDSKFLAIGNLNRGGISVLRLDKTSGSLTAVAGSPFSTSGGGFPWQLAFHKSGKFLYAGMQISVTSNISAFSIDASTGALTPVPGSPFSGQPAIGGGGAIPLHFILVVTSCMRAVHSRASRDTRWTVQAVALLSYQDLPLFRPECSLTPT